MENSGQIYKLIGTAIGKIGAIGKDQFNPQQKFKYRGIDQVYNALNPVMAELGIFFCPEVLDQKREERTTASGTILKYTILTMKFTAYAPDGSSVSMTVVGEGMDSGDKSANKAMSVAMKYAMFQLFCIPTEEMKDPDADSYNDILPKGTPANVQISPAAKVPPINRDPNPRDGEVPGAFIGRRISEMKTEFQGFDFMAARAELIKTGKVQDVPSATMDMAQAKALMSEVHAYYARKAS